MTALLEIKESLKGIYTKYDIYIVPFLKFVLALVTLLMINASLGYMETLKNPAVLLIAALICSFMPINVLLLIAAVFCMGHVYTLSFECAAILGVVFLLLFLLYFRFAPGDAIVVLLTPIMFGLHVPYAIPLCCGLVGTPMSAVAAACGLIVYHVLGYISQNSSVIGNLEVDTEVQKFQYIIDNLLNNKSLIVMIVAFAVTIILVYVIKRLSIDFSWNIAVVAGIIACIIFVMAGSMAFSVDISIVGVILSSIVSVALTFVLQFFVFSVDYSRTEHLQFEDDEYYYYVKAVPKMSVAPPERKVKHINSQKKGPSRERAASMVDNYPVFNQGNLMDDLQSRNSSRTEAVRTARQPERPRQPERSRQPDMTRTARPAGRGAYSAASGSTGERASQGRTQTPGIGAGAQRYSTTGRRSYSTNRSGSTSMAAPRNGRVPAMDENERRKRISSPTRSFFDDIDKN